MTTTRTYAWQGAGTPLPDGHTIVQGNAPDGSLRWAIFDQSGRRPELTDDGVLWLDQSRCLDASTRHAPTIPIVGEDGKRWTTPSDAPTILYLSRMLRWTIADETRGRYYSASDVRGAEPYPAEILLRRAHESGQLAGTLVGADVERYLEASS